MATGSRRRRSLQTDLPACWWRELKAGDLHSRPRVNSCAAGPSTSDHLPSLSHPWISRWPWSSTADWRHHYRRWVQLHPKPRVTTHVVIVTIWVEQGVLKLLEHLTITSRWWSIRKHHRASSERITGTLSNQPKYENMWGLLGIQGSWSQNGLHSKRFLEEFPKGCSVISSRCSTRPFCLFTGSVKTPVWAMNGLDILLHC